MWPLLLALCLFICGCDSGPKGNQWASQNPSDPEICESLSQKASQKAKLNKSSCKICACDWCSTATPQLERSGVYELGERDCSTNGLAMPSVLDLGVHAEGAMHRMRSALVEGMEEAQESTSIAKPETKGQGQEWRYSQGRQWAGGSCAIYRTNSLDSEHTEYPSLQQLANGRVYGSQGGQPDDGGWVERLATRAFTTQASSSEFVESGRAPQRTQRGYGAATRRVGSPTATARSRETCRKSSQLWAYQQNGEIATTVAYTTGEGAEVGYGLEAVCDPGPGKVQQAQGPVYGDPQTTPQVHSRKERGSGSSEGRDLESINVTAATTRRGGGRRAGVRNGRSTIDGESTGCTRPASDVGGVPRSGNGRGGREWSTSGCNASTSKAIFQTNSGRITIQGCERTLKEQKCRKDRRAEGDVTYTCDLLQGTENVSIDCLLEDVFSGFWCWMHRESDTARNQESIGRQVRFNPQVEVVHFVTGLERECCYAEITALTPCPCDRWCVEVGGDAGMLPPGPECGQAVQDWNSHDKGGSEVCTEVSGPLPSVDERDEGLVSLMQIGVSAGELRSDPRSDVVWKATEEDVKATVWLIGRQGRTMGRPQGAMLCKGRVHEWQLPLKRRWTGLFGDGDPHVAVVEPHPPRRDVDYEFPEQGIHILVSMQVGASVLLDVECPEWKMRDAWVVHARTVADLFVRVGLENYIHNPRFDCVLDVGGTILSPDQRISLSHGYYGKLIVTELVAWDYESSGESSGQASTDSLSSGLSSCDAFSGTDDDWSDTALNDMMSLFQSFGEKVFALNYGSEPECASYRFLEEGISVVDSLFVDVPDLQDGVDDDDDDDPSEIDDMLRITNPLDLHHAQETVTPDAEGRWRLVSFGLKDHDIGRRDAMLHSLEQFYVEQAVWMLWQDEVPQFAPLVIHYVVPQPTSALGLSHAIVVIAEILQDSDMDAAEEDHSAILSVQVNERGQVLRQPKTHRVPRRCRFDHLHGLHDESFLCRPYGVRRCSLRVGGRTVQESSVVDVIPGSLNQLVLEVMMPQLLEASSWFPKVEVWASHVTNEFSLDQVDDFVASIYVPGWNPVNIPFAAQDVQTPEAFKRRISVTTQLTEFVALYLDDNVITRVSRALGRHHHFMIWDLHAIMQPIFVAVEEGVGQGRRRHVTAIDPQGLLDIGDLQLRVEEQLGLVHTTRSCTQRGHVVGFYSMNPEEVVVFQSPAVGVDSDGDYPMEDSAENFDESGNNDDTEESSGSVSLLQRGVWLHKATPSYQNGYTEGNMDLRSGRKARDACSAEVTVSTPCPRDRWCVGTEAEANTYPSEQSIDSRVATLQGLLRELREAWPKDAIANCYDQIPDLHPFARLALASTSGNEFRQIRRYHVFTDGSAKRDAHQSGKAAWAFHVVCESEFGTSRTFHRIGFTGAMVDGNLWSCHMDSLDAEAVALIHVADWLISQKGPIDCTVHFDAKAVGFGAFGHYNVACDASAPREIQHVARALFAVAQALHPGLKCAHVKAHDGQPDNETADSIAYAILRGWEPPCHPPCRVCAIAAHPLRDWAWMECAPNAELPSIENVLKGMGYPAQLGADYLEVGEMMAESQVTSVTWKFGSANVCTLEDPKDNAGVKVGILQKQAQQACYDVFILQETRSRHDMCSENDDFLRIGSAAHNGQGGVEIWFRKRGSFLETGFGEIQKNHLIAWHADHRILGLSIMHPALECDIVGIYAPQSGRTDQEIKDWWSTLCEVLDKRPSHGPLFLIGDANAKIGAVNSSAIGDLAPDFEDCAGEMLRDCCSRFSLILPSTFGEWHEGPTATFSSTRGGQSRVDYIAVPEACRDGVTGSWVDEDFDLMNGDFDHKAI